MRAGLCTEQMDDVMLGNTAIVTAKHRERDVLCHLIRHSSSLTGTALHTQEHAFMAPSGRHCRSIPQGCAPEQVGVQEVWLSCGISKETHLLLPSGHATERDPLPADFSPFAVPGLAPALSSGTSSTSDACTGTHLSQFAVFAPFFILLVLSLLFLDSCG